MTPYRVGLTGGLASGKSTVAGWLRDAGFQVFDADQLVAELYRPRAAGAAAARDLFGPSVLTPEGGVDHRVLADQIFGDPAARSALEQAIHPLVRRRFEELAGGAGSGPADALSPSAAPAAALSPSGAPAAALSPSATPADALSPSATPAAAPISPAAPHAGAGTGSAPARPAARVVVLEAALLDEAGYAADFDLVVTVAADPEARLRRAVARGMREEDARARLAAQAGSEHHHRGPQLRLNNDGDLAALRRQVDLLIADIAELSSTTLAPRP
jgi:dephospho-CoA kinase